MSNPKTLFFSSVKKGDLIPVKEEKCKSPNLVNVTAAKAPSVSSAKSVGSARNANAADDYAPGELRPLKSNVNDHKIKSIKSPSKESGNEMFSKDRSPLGELADKAKDDDSLESDELKSEEAIISELVQEEPETIAHLVPQPNEDPGEESEIGELAGEPSATTDDTPFFSAIRKMISTGGGLDKLKMKHEYLGYLEAIQSYSKWNTNEPDQTKDVAAGAEASSEFVRIEAKSDGKCETDLNPLNQSDFQVDYEQSSSTISPSCSESSLNSSRLFKASANESDAPAKEATPEKAKKSKKEAVVSFFDSNGMTVALYGAAGTIVSAALYYLINR